MSTSDFKVIDGTVRSVNEMFNARRDSYPMKKPAVVWQSAIKCKPDFLFCFIGKSRILGDQDRHVLIMPWKVKYGYWEAGLDPLFPNDENTFGFGHSTVP